MSRSERRYTRRRTGDHYSKENCKGFAPIITRKYAKERDENKHLNNLISRLQIDVDFFQREIEELKSTTDNTLRNYQHIYLELLEQQRKLLNEMNRLSEFDEELIRKYLSLIDVEEFKIREKQIQE